MKNIEPLKKEPAKAGVEESAPIENPLDTPNDDEDTTESEFAPWE